MTDQELELVMIEINAIRESLKRNGETMDRIMAMLNSMPISLAQLKARLERLENPAGSTQ